MTSPASKRPGNRRAEAAAKRRKPPSNLPAVTRASADSASPHGTPQNLADRYYAMAEEMNSRGAMELAVPFYRQALALLMAERQQLQAQLPADQLHGLLEAAEHWEQQEAAGPVAVEAPTPLPRADLEPRIAELQEDLSPESAQQVLAALQELETAHAGLSDSGWSLRGRAAILLGESQQALAAFQEASRLAPDRADHRINAGGALLVCGHVAEALELLEGLQQEQPLALTAEQQIALWRNVAAATAQAGRLEAALQHRHAWLQAHPQSESVERWLHWAQQGLAAEQPEAARGAALAMLQTLHQLHPQHRSVMEALAAGLEAEGRYREASLLYRNLLRPDALSPQP